MTGDDTKDKRDGRAKFSPIYEWVTSYKDISLGYIALLSIPAIIQ
jgi:hypothetical protein